MLIYTIPWTQFQRLTDYLLKLRLRSSLSLLGLLGVIAVSTVILSGIRSCVPITLGAILDASRHAPHSKQVYKEQQSTVWAFLSVVSQCTTEYPWNLFFLYSHYLQRLLPSDLPSELVFMLVVSTYPVWYQGKLSQLSHPETHTRLFNNWVCLYVWLLPEMLPRASYLQFQKTESQ